MRIPAAVVLALVPAAICANEPSAWRQEPSSVFGIELGKPFPSPAQIGDCPVFEPFRREPQDEGLCVDTRKGFSGDAIALKNVPLAAVTDEATVILRNGIVQAVVMSFDPARYAAARESLVARYGPPHARETQDVASAASADMGETIAWRGPRTSITLQERTADRTSRIEFRLR